MVEPILKPIADYQLDGPTDGVLTFRFFGPWTVHTMGMVPEGLEARVFDSGDVQRLVFDLAGLEDWDSALVTLMVYAQRRCAERQIEFERKNSPPGLKELLAIAASGRREARTVDSERTSLLTKVGEESIKIARSLGDMLGFFGESCQALFRWVTGRSRMRSADLYLVIEQVGPQALPIVTLICFLIGVIMAFVGAIQLQQFGAEIFVANLVGIGMTRELGPVMVGIVMAGRTGAAFAAQLGTMTVNEEVAALRTTGIPPIDFLVLPRLVALIIMMPLLTIYANIVGMLGGMLIADVMLDISAIEYFNQTAKSVSLVDWAGGLVKASIFGVLVAVAGCMRGMQAGRSALDVGIAATSAVVTGIVLIIAVDATLTVFYTVIGI